jgi:hypothetical protein
MKLTNPNSEVARLLQRITEEYEAAERAMNGFAVTSQHEFITARMEQMGLCHLQLQGLVGEMEATQMVADTLARAGTEKIEPPGMQ